MKQRKIAISLAVVGAIAAPFVLHTYKMQHPKWQTWRSLTAEGRQQITKNLSECRPSELSADGSWCPWYRKSLEEGGYYAPAPSIVLYLLSNVGVAVAGFSIIFGLTYLFPALIRRYWRWLNT